VKRLDEATVLTFLPGMILNSVEGVRVNDLAMAIGGVLRVVADLSHFDVIPSFLLGTLVTLHLRLAKAGGKLKLCGLRPDVLAAVKVTSLDRVLDICDDEAGALASF
jgi:anti-sigma B factor antagonist